MISMSERSSISLAEVLGENYYIDKLTSSEYSPAVGDTVTITLSVNDVFGDPANGQTRTVTCTGGSFVSVNGSSITSSSSVEVTTGSGGTVTLGLSVSVADTIIVSDGRCDCVVCSLSNSITNISAYYYQRVSLSSNVWSGGNTLYLHRVGQLVIAIIPSKSLTYGSGYTGWQNMITIPSGFRPISDTPMACINNSSTNYNQWQTNGNYIRVYVGSANTSQFTGAIGVWFTNDATPSQ